MKVDLSDAMVDARAQQIVEDMAQRVGNQGISIEQYLGWMGTTVEEFAKSQRANAEKTIRQELALKKVADLEGITVEEEDRDRELQKVADQYGVELESVKTFMDTDMLEESLLYTKAADFVIANAVALPEEKVAEAAAEAAAKDEAAE